MLVSGEEYVLEMVNFSFSFEMWEVSQKPDRQNNNTKQIKLIYIYCYPKYFLICLKKSTIYVKSFKIKTLKLVSN